MFVTIVAFAYIWIVDFKKTKGDKNARIVFLALFFVSLTVAILISLSVKIPSPVKAVKAFLDFTHMKY